MKPDIKMRRRTTPKMMIGINSSPDMALLPFWGVPSSALARRQCLAHKYIRNVGCVVAGFYASCVAVWKALTMWNVLQAGSGREERSYSRRSNHQGSHCIIIRYTLSSIERNL